MQDKNFRSFSELGPSEIEQFHKVVAKFVLQLQILFRIHLEQMFLSDDNGVIQVDVLPNFEGGDSDGSE